MSTAPHATPLVSDVDNVGRFWLAYQVDGGAMALETFTYDYEDGSWRGIVTEVFSASTVSTRTSDVIYQPGDLEPSIGQDSDGRIWYASCGASGALFFARIEPNGPAIEDWSSNVSRPSPGRTLRYPGFIRVGDELYFRASVLVDGTGTVPGDIGFGLWRWSGAEWLVIGGTQDDSTCLAWYDTGIGGNSAYQYAVFSMAPGQQNMNLHLAWVKQTNADLNAAQGTEVHFAYSNDGALTWYSADDVELGQSGVSGLPIVAGDAGTAGTGAGTLIATDAVDSFFRPVTVSVFSDGSPMVAAAKKTGPKFFYIYEAGAWTTIALGSERGITPNRAIAYGSSSVAVPVTNGWWVSTDRANGFLAWTFAAEAEATMGAGMNQYVDLGFLRRTGWVRWVGDKSTADGGAVNNIIVGEANLFGAADYLVAADTVQRRGFAGRSRTRRVQ